MELRRLISVATALAVAAAVAPASALAAEEPRPSNPVPRIRVVRELTFPVVGPARYEESFGDCRDGCDREHHGIDIFSYGWKGVPVVAAHAGIVERAEVYGRQRFCSIHIRAGDGWETRYVHLNTDTPGTDDGDFPEGCAAPGVAVGRYVRAGQIIGWLGDSGNAERHSVHLHFELRTPKGTPVDPWRSLERAERIGYTMLDPMEPVAAAVAVSAALYPGGHHVAFVTTVDPSAGDGIGLPWSAAMPGPVLVTGDGGVDPAVRAELGRLQPDVVVVLERPGEGSPAAELRGLARTVERIVFPGGEARSAILPAGHRDVSLPVVAPGFQVTVAQRPPGDLVTRRALSDLAAVVPTVQVAPPDAAPVGRGLPAVAGPERPGLRRAVYYPTGEQWEAYPLDGPSGAPTPGLIFIVAGDEANASTFTFLRSLAAVPPTPYWR